MPITTYYTEQEVRHHQARLDDKELQELLNEIEQLTGRIWFIRKDKFFVPVAVIFKKTVFLYQLLVEVGGEWQVINFPGCESSINTSVSREMVMTYLLGYVSGMLQ